MFSRAKRRHAEGRGQRMARLGDMDINTDMDLLCKRLGKISNTKANGHTVDT